MKSLILALALLGSTSAYDGALPPVTDCWK